MAGLNHGKSFRRFIEEKFPNEEGVFYSEVSKKWVVRMENKSINKIKYPFVSAVQFETEIEANQKYQDIKKQF